MEIDVVSKRKISKNCLVVELEFDFFDFAGRSGKSGNTVENALYQYVPVQVFVKKFVILMRLSNAITGSEPGS